MKYELRPLTQSIFNLDFWFAIIDGASNSH